MPTTKKSSRRRAVASLANDVGVQRHQLFKAGYARITSAIASGWYLEAIVLVESLLTDRFESRLTHLTGTNVAFLNLGPLIDLVRANETNPLLTALVAGDIDSWRRRRNAAAHEMLKIEEGTAVPFEDRLGALRLVAQDGVRLLRSYSKLAEKDRARGSVR